jgi:hypothetical protein
MGLTPAFLACFIPETLKGPCPLQIKLGQLAKLGGSSLPPGHNIFAIRVPPRIRQSDLTTCQPRKPHSQLGHPGAKEMVLHTAHFKPAAGGGEV